MIVAIDPGSKGGVAFEFDGELYAIPMPPNVSQIPIPAPVTMAVIEKVHAFPGQGVVSMFSFGVQYGKVLAWAEMQTDNIHLIEPRTWLKMYPGEGKQRTIDYCTEHFPEVSLYPGRKRTPHDGMADALCLLNYAKKHLTYP